MIPSCSSRGVTTHADLICVAVSSHPIAAETKPVTFGLSRAISMELTDQDRAMTAGANRC